jgi:large subunit ribosomal protein L35
LKKCYFCHPKIETMPKVKTHSRAKKTFKVTGTGKIRRYKAFKSHLLTKKSKTRKRHLRAHGLVHSANLDLVKRMLGMR